MGDFNEALINAKYHLAVVERMFKSYEGYADKRFLVGIIRESSRSVSNLIRAFLIRENLGGKDSKGNMKIFMKVVAPKYLDSSTIENLVKILEVERAHKVSPIEYAKGDKIILLIDGNYRFLTAQRLNEFVQSIKESIGRF